MLFVLDFNKNFDIVSSNILVGKLIKWGGLGNGQ